MQKTSKLTVLEIILMVLASFLAGAIGGFFLDSFRKKIASSDYIKTKEQKSQEEFRDDLAMEMGELR